MREMPEPKRAPRAIPVEPAEARPAPAPIAPRPSRWIVPDLGGLLALGAALAIARSLPRSFDLFFHLASGRQILAHGFPASDPFSPNASGPQFPHEWAFGVLAELLVRRFGAAGPELLVSALAAGTLLLLWRALGEAKERGLLAAVAFLLAAAALGATWVEERPYHFGMLLFAAALLLAQRWRRGSERAAWALVPLTALWANLHGSWVLGPALFAATAAGALIDGPDEAARRRALRALGIALLAYLAAGISIPGPRIYLYPFEHALLPQNRTILEWKPLAFGEADAGAFGLLAALVAFLGGRSRRPRLALLLPCVGLALSTAAVARQLPFALLCLAPAAAELGRDGPPLRLPGALAGALHAIDHGLVRWSEAARGFALAAVPIAVVGALALRSPQRLIDRLGDDYPVAALRKLATLPPGRVLNRWRWGGAVSYLDGTAYPVFIDARNDVFPLSVHEDYRKLRLLLPGWQEALARYRPRYLLWSESYGGNPLLEALRCRGGWREIASDESGLLWERIGAASEGSPPR